MWDKTVPHPLHTMRAFLSRKLRHSQTEHFQLVLNNSGIVSYGHAKGPRLGQIRSERPKYLLFN